MADTLADLPVLRTARLRLRPLRPADAAQLRETTDDPAITGAVHFLPTPFTLADAERLIPEDSERDCFLGAWDHEGARLAAVVGMHLHGREEIEVGYWVRASLHGRGYATEAVAAVLAMLRRHLPHRRIVAECRVENAVSWHLLGKLGFRAAGEVGRRPDRRRLVLA